MWEIKPFAQVGPIEFGQLRNEVRSKLDSDYQVFKKTPGENDTDAYDSLGIHVYFDDDDQVEFVEAFSPAELEYEGIALIGRNVDEVVADLRARGYEAEKDDVGYNYDELGFGLTVNGDVIEGVGVFRKGYYE